MKPRSRSVQEIDASETNRPSASGPLCGTQHVICLEPIFNGGLLNIVCKLVPKFYTRALRVLVQADALGEKNALILKQQTARGVQRNEAHACSTCLSGVGHSSLEIDMNKGDIWKLAMITAAVVVVVSILPDINRYIRISTM